SANNGFRGNAAYRSATFNTRDLNASLNYKKGKLGVTGFINAFSSDGYNLSESEFLSTVEPFENYTFNSRITYALNDATDLSLSGRYFYQKQDVVASETLTGENEINEWNTHFNVNHKLNNRWKAYFEMYVTNFKTTEYLNNTDDARYSEDFYDQLFLRPELRVVYSLNQKNEFTGGMGLTRETLNRTNFSESPEFNSPYAFIQYDSPPTD